MLIAEHHSVGTCTCSYNLAFQGNTCHILLGHNYVSVTFR